MKLMTAWIRKSDHRYWRLNANPGKEQFIIVDVEYHDCSSWKDTTISSYWNAYIYCKNNNMRLTDTDRLTLMKNVDQHLFELGYIEITEKLKTML
jgi:hypothetical protein